MRSLNKEMAGKPSKEMLVSCCWLRCVAPRRRHQAECSDPVLWPNTWSCSVTAHAQLLLGLGFLWLELFCWKVPITPFLSEELSLSSKGPHPQTIYVSRSKWFYLSCLDTSAYLGLSVLSVVMQEVYGKQRSQNTTQAKAVTTLCHSSLCREFFGSRRRSQSAVNNSSMFPLHFNIWL